MVVHFTYVVWNGQVQCAVDTDLVDGQYADNTQSVCCEDTVGDVLYIANLSPKQLSTPPLSPLLVHHLLYAVHTIHRILYIQTVAKSNIDSQANSLVHTTVSHQPAWIFWCINLQHQQCIKMVLDTQVLQQVNNHLANAPMHNEIMVLPASPHDTLANALTKL